VRNLIGCVYIAHGRQYMKLRALQGILSIELLTPCEVNRCVRWTTAQGLQTYVELICLLWNRGSLTPVSGQVAWIVHGLRRPS